jgi:uncharacterized protein DUF6866
MTDLFMQDIKLNCNVSDARFWGYFSICGLLMRYRDLYRSEQGLDPWSPVPRQDISAWIEHKEAGWPDLEMQDFRSVRQGTSSFDPFDTTGINGWANPLGYVYGAGYGMYLKPTFFLGRLVSVSEIEGHRVYTSGQELVRDLFTAPAMLQERTIFLRLEPLKALLWDAFCRVRPGCPSVLADAFLRQGIEPGQAPDQTFVAAIDRMASSYAEVLLWHELSESRERLSGWKDLIAASDDRTTELFLRGLQDLVADTSEDGPLRRIIDRRDAGMLATMVGLLDGFRKALFPELRDVYRRFSQEGSWALVKDTRAQAYERLRELRREVRESFRKGGKTGLQQLLRQKMQGMI